MKVCVGRWNSAPISSAYVVQEFPDPFDQVAGHEVAVLVGGFGIELGLFVLAGVHRCSPCARGRNSLFVQSHRAMPAQEHQALRTVIQP